MLRRHKYGTWYDDEHWLQFLIHTDENRFLSCSENSSQDNNETELTACIISVSLWHLVFLSIFATFLIFCIMSNIASHAQRTPSDMFLRSNWYSCLFFLVSIWKDSLQVFRQLHLCFPWHWESLPGTAQCPPWPSSDIVARLRVNACHSQWLTLRLTLFQDVFTQILVQVCMCYNCFIHLLFFFWNSLFCSVDQSERMSICVGVYEIIWFSVSSTDSAR